MLRLLPALKIDGKIIVGEIGDTHNGLGNSPPESSRGFVPEDDHKQFLSRKQAVAWMKKYDLPHMRKLPSKAFYIGLHSEHLAKAYGVPVKAVPKVQPAPEPPPAKTTEPEKLDLSAKTAIVYDRGGLYLYCAEKLAEKFGKVMYYLADSDAYPTSQKHTIGAGLPKVKRIHDLWKHIDEADIICFFDCYDGQLQAWLRGKGHKVFGSGLGEKVEIDRVYFLETLEKLGLPCPKTYLAEGMTDLCEYLDKNDGKTLYLKNLHRGDFESRKYTGMAQSRPFLNDLKKRLGSASDTIEVLVQDKVDSACEVGWDGYQLDGKYSENGLIGYELKDRGYCSVIADKKPDILAKIDGAFAPEFKRLGYAGNYSTEVRITKDGTPYFIDATCRTPSPGGELQCEIYENWAEIVWHLAHEKLIEPKPRAKFGAEIVLRSSWHEDHEIHVKFPKEIAECVKLKNHTKRDGEWYCIPNGNGGYFGAVVAYADTMEEAVKKVLEYAEQIEADELELDSNVFETIQKSIAAGKKFL